MWAWLGPSDQLVKYQPQDNMNSLYLWLSYKSKIIYFLLSIDLVFVDWLKLRTFHKNQEILWVLKNPSHGNIDSHSQKAINWTKQNHLLVDTFFRWILWSSVYSCSSPPSSGLHPFSCPALHAQGLHLLYCLGYLPVPCGQWIFCILGSFFP